MLLKAAEITEKFCFYLGEYCFHRLLQWFIMIAVNSKILTIATTVTCPLAFLGYCRNSNLLMAGTVDNAGTLQNSGWC